MKVNELDINKIIILESLNETKERLTGKELNTFISRNINHINTEYHGSLTKKELISKLQETSSITKEEDGVLLFIEAHGSIDGITALDENLTWNELNTYLSCINKASALGLVVVFSCCFGAHFYTETKILKQAPYYVMIGVDKEISEHKLIQLNELLITGFENEEPLKVIEDSANDIMPMIDCHLTILDAGALFHGVFADYLIQSTDEEAMHSRASRNFQKKDSEIKLSYSEFTALTFHMFMNKEYLEKKFYELKECFLLTDVYIQLNERFETMFDEIYEKSDVDSKYKSILAKDTFTLTKQTSVLKAQFLKSL